MDKSSTTCQRLTWAFLLLSCFYAVGCTVFRYLERDAEIQTYADNEALYMKMQSMYSFHYCEDPAFQQLSFCKDQASFSASLLEYFNEHGNSFRDNEQWTAFGSSFYLTHLVTTIGYGTNSPRTPAGQIATIVFAFIGIPIMGYTLIQVARLDMDVSVFLLERVFCMKVRTLRDQMVILWGLLVIILFGGAYVYSRLEPWSFCESLYFCFVTLSTIGFGDFLPSSMLSRAFSIFYMIFGLGVCASILGVLTGCVAEGHDSVDAFVTEQIEAHCSGCTKRTRD